MVRLRESGKRWARRVGQGAIGLALAAGLLTFAQAGVATAGSATPAPTWTQAATTGPLARRDAATAFDPATGQLLLFGGLATSGLNDTWVWDGTAWSQLSPAHQPPARFGATMAFDPATGQLVLFGGDGSAFLDDTWVWDGADWSQQSPADHPSARVGASMTFDSATGQLVLFGGYGGGELDDTWAWDGSDWSQLSPAHKPSARDGASMAFDPATGQLVLFGGEGAISVDDTWAWDGADWSQLSPAHKPSARYNAAMAFDPATGQLLLFGGKDSGGELGDTWSWDGADWSQLSPADQPPARVHASMAFDPATGQLVLFGGGLGTLLGDTWVWGYPTGTAFGWDNRGTGGPSVRRSASIAFDPAIGKLVLFGGRDGSTFHNDTWTWNGTAWTELSPATSPGVREDASMAFDPAIGKLVLFGGQNSGSRLDDTWTFDGTTWNDISDGTDPSARLGAAMAFDPKMGKLVLFGGADGSTTFGDTYSWDPTNHWTSLDTTATPTQDTSIAFDQKTGKLVLFGGSAAGTTREWNDTSWDDVTPATHPSASGGAGFAYDEAVGGLTLVGGLAGTLPTDEVWTFDTAAHAWTQSTQATPTARRFPATAFDPATGQLVVFGGYEGTNDLGDTWVYAVETPPGAPTGVTATAGNARATVSFTAPTSDGGAAITGYTVTSDPDGKTATGTGSPITVTGLANGTPYTFTVVATNAVGDGTASVASASVTPSAAPPAPTTPTPAPPVLIAGANRDGTAIAASKQQFPTAGSASAVVLARNNLFPDALAGGPLAAAKNAPLLLTPTAELDPTTADEITRVLAPGGTVYLLGGDDALSPRVETALTQRGFAARRLAGPDRFATATIVADLIDGPRTVFEADGLDFPDAMAAVPAAITTHGLILLTNGDHPADATTAWLAAHPHLTRYAVGAPAVTADPSAQPLAGDTRYATAIAVATTLFPHTDGVGIASAADFPDSMAGGPIVGALNQPMLLVPPSGLLPTDVHDYLHANRNTLTNLMVFGGENAIGTDIRGEIQTALNQ